MVHGRVEGVIWCATGKAEEQPWQRLEVFLCIPGGHLGSQWENNASGQDFTLNFTLFHTLQVANCSANVRPVEAMQLSLRPGVVTVVGVGGVRSVRGGRGRYRRYVAELRVMTAVGVGTVKEGH